MKTSKHQSFWEWAKISLAVNVLLVISAGFAGYSAYRIFGQALSVRQEYREAAAEIEALLQKKTELESRIRELESPQAMEREAKERLNLKMSGEEVVVVVPETESAQRSEPQKTWWGKIQRFFNGK